MLDEEHAPASSTSLKMSSHPVCLYVIFAYGTNHPTIIVTIHAYSHHPNYSYIDRYREKAQYIYRVYWHALDNVII